MIKTACSIIFALFQGIWRRIFGGYQDPWGIIEKIDKYGSVRFLCEVIEIVVVGGVVILLNGSSWLTGLLVGLIVTLLFWLPGHGPWFDIGRGGYPDEAMIKRYEEVWWDKLLKKMFKEKNWYGPAYDFVGLGIRYVLPCILLVPFFGISILLMGLGIPVIYGTFWACSKFLPKTGPTGWAEIFSGMLTGICLSLDQIWLDVGQFLLNLF